MTALPLTAPGNVRIGISGWTYPGWRGVFYPEKLPHRRELAFAAQAFPTIEINGTFYSLQRPTSFAKWAAETPDGFAFAIKGSRFITHMKKLRQVRTALANFLASGVLQLDAKLGPFLWQFPPQFPFHADLLDEFFGLLPRDTFAAAELAGEHDARLKGRAFLTPVRRRPLRHAIEIRHPSCIAPEFIRLLRRQRIALVCADTVEWPRLMDVTADFVYVRLHGSKQLYASGYDDVDLDAWAQRVAAWARGGQPAAGATHPGVPPCEYASTLAPPKRQKRDVYVYFDNDAKVRAPFDAQGLITRVNRLPGR
ncbi:MAG TPA: DUF72 domain-containing protein [Acidobacteriaceae bacterium]|nr:DUF72 domain-containing protein [Acidobacteriaceae bacterium]